MYFNLATKCLITLTKCIVIVANAIPLNGVLLPNPLTFIQVQCSDAGSKHWRWKKPIKLNSTELLASRNTDKVECCYKMENLNSIWIAHCLHSRIFNAAWRECLWFGSGTAGLGKGDVEMSNIHRTQAQKVAAVGNKETNWLKLQPRTWIQMQRVRILEVHRTKTGRSV